MLLECARLMFLMSLSHLFFGLFLKWALSDLKKSLLLLQYGIILTFSAYIVAFLLKDNSVAYCWAHLKNIDSITGAVGLLWAGSSGANLLFLLGMSQSALWGLRLIPQDLPFEQISGLKRVIIPQLLFMAAVTLTHSHPFEHYWPFPPTESQELNPLLQHHALSYHPPLLLCGTSSLFGLLIIEAVLRHSPEQRLYQLRQRWLYLSLAVIGLGITAGSHWAYHVLGWGGWWFWDPIETISLINWVGALALLHHKSAEASKQYWNAQSLWACIVLGLVLVRGGGLISVHSFVNEQNSFILLCWLLVSFFCAVIDWPSFWDTPKNHRANGLIAIVGIMVSGLLIPVFLSFFGFFSSHLSPSYYENTVGVCLLFFLILERFSAVGALGYLCAEVFLPSYTTPLAASCLLLDEWLHRIGSQQRLIAHSVMYAGIAIMSMSPLYESQQYLDLSTEHSSTFAGSSVVWQAQDSITLPHCQKTCYKLQIEKNGEVVEAVVEKIFYPSSQQELTPITYITNRWGADIGISATTHDGHFRFFYRPFVRWIWASMIVLSFEFLRRSLGLKKTYARTEAAVEGLLQTTQVLV